MCVQRFDDSRNSAIHITYRISLRSSSLREPRDPLSKVVLITFFRFLDYNIIQSVSGRRKPARDMNDSQDVRKVLKTFYI